ncbi:putative sodium-coupled neutral amino acid transporter 10 [Diachasmimorpha longicaudata]|uniref:putative sodium-coupled neutral amino acid transporter 10 n=1 Tax=Diachasmimorpha longicaudata TaxID=58733 RepID=UPI0030B8B6DA
MTSHVPHVMTLANSIIGVSVLAMPFCFKQCGIALATVVLLLCSLLSRLACHFLIKSAVMSRRRNFEFLAFHAFGHMGKFLVELFIIGFLLGTCIAFYVVIGDLGPQIIGKMLNKNPEDIRISFLLTTGALIVLPLGLLRNIDSLSTICTATIGFYICLVLKVIIESTNHIFKGDWYDKVNYWRPAGILQCLPIFSMALFCQTQLFEIYESILNVSLEKMNLVVRGALNICTMVYLCVGFFGYIAFCSEPFTGNILMILEPSATSDMIKIGFVLSVLFSFPLVIFPCRASLNSLLFRRVQTHEPTNNYIPEMRFRCLTLIIVTVALITGIMMPNIEFVLGLVGSTIGVMICLILPTACFIVISTKDTNERLLAQVISFVGVCIMILGTYANLYAMEEASTSRITVPTGKPVIQINNIDLNLIKNNEQLQNINKLQPNFNLDSAKIPDMMSIPQESLRGKEPLKQVDQVAPVKAVEPELPPEPLKPAAEAIAPPGDPPQAKDTIKQDQQASEILINSEAKKNEYAEVAHPNVKLTGESNDEVKQHHFLKKLEEHKTDIRKLIEEQKVLLQDIEHHKEELEMEKRKRLQDKEPTDEDKINDPSKNENILSKNEIPQESEVKIKSSDSGVNDKKERDTSGYLGKVESPGDSKVMENSSLGERQNVKNFNAESVNQSTIGSRGPIVDVLTNWTATRKDSQVIANPGSQSQDVSVKKEVEEVKKNVYQLPIPLQLINQTKEKGEANGDGVKGQTGQRDVRENSRDKREVQGSEGVQGEGRYEGKELGRGNTSASALDVQLDDEFQMPNKRDLKNLKGS